METGEIDGVEGYHRDGQQEADELSVTRKVCLRWKKRLILFGGKLSAKGNATKKVKRKMKKNLNESILII